MSVSRTTSIEESERYSWIEKLQDAVKEHELPAQNWERRRL